MSSRKNIDMVFKEKFESADIRLSAGDEDLFLKNISKITSTKKKKRGIIFFALSILLLGTFSSLFFLLNNKNERYSGHIQNTAATSTADEMDVFDTQPEIESPQLQQESTKTTIITNQFQYPQNDFYVNNNNPASSSVFSEVNPQILAGPGLAENRMTLQEAAMPIKNHYNLKSFSVKPQYVTFSLSSIQLKPYAPYPPKPAVQSKFGIEVHSGYSRVTGNWTAKANNNSHQDLKEFTSNKKSAGAGIISGIGVKYRYGRFSLGMSITNTQMQIQTNYNERIKNAPIIDSATGIIRGYLNLGQANEIAVPSQKDRYNQFQIPILLDYNMFEKNRHSFSVGFGLGLNLNAGYRIKTFDLNTVKMSNSYGKMAPVFKLIGCNYQSSINPHLSIGLQFQARFQTVNNTLEFGTEKLNMVQYSLFPVITIK